MGITSTAAPFAQEAVARLRSLLANRWVRLEQEGPAVDLYNRHVAYVMTDDGQCVNTVMVKDGLARVSRSLGAFPLSISGSAPRSGAMFALMGEGRPEWDVSSSREFWFRHPMSRGRRVICP